MSADWHPICPNCGAESRQIVKEEITIFYDNSSLHVHGFPSATRCLKCNWSYEWEYLCPSEAEHDGYNEEAPKKSTRKSRKSH